MDVQLVIADHDQSTAGNIIRARQCECSQKPQTEHHSVHSPVRLHNPAHRSRLLPRHILKAPMRLACWLALLLVPGSSNAWDTGPHRRITKAALDAMPKSFVDRLGADATALFEIYCMYPDRYLEMEQFGFVRKSPGPHSADEIRQ